MKKAMKRKTDKFDAFQTMRDCIKSRKKGIAYNNKPEGEVIKSRRRKQINKGMIPMDQIGNQ